MAAPKKPQEWERALWDTPIGAAALAGLMFTVGNSPTGGWTIYSLGWAGPLAALARSAARRAAPWGGGIAPALIGTVAGILFWIFYG
ncbi:hypothetical protein [Streptomyces syringium]|uniref:hypothetical protein n=1 Tax=Streptomyces syringium TaxID=76729 RepID=UPI0034123AD4